MTKKTIPAISIVIPMYNAEKYIAECLDSILAQTFDDYEVIVVDDCSTDKSAAVVESYTPKFKGKLQLVRSKVNSGGCPGIPRNTGMRISCGEYLMFVDADDAITETALEELYSIAKKFDADVVHFDKYYTAPGNTITTDKNLLKENKWATVKPVLKSELMSENITERMQEFGTQKMLWTSWCNFIRRSVVAKNNIEFPKMFVAEDLLFTVFLLCLAEKFVRIPSVFYVWRDTENSLTRELSTADKRIRRFAGSIFRGIESLDKFMSGIELFQKNPAYRYLIFDVLTNTNISLPHQIIPIYAQIPAHQLDGLIRRELNDVEDKTALTAFLFARMNIFNVNILQQRQLIQKQQQQIQQLQAQLQQMQQFNLDTEDIFK